MIQTKNSSVGAGYRIERIYVAEQHYEQVNPAGLRESESTEDRGIGVRWDWRPLGPRRFEVLIELTLEAVSAAPEEARVRILGIFEALENAQSVSFVDFLRTNAPAILFPFGREVLSTMTGRGFYGTCHLNPINVLALLKDFDFSTTTGFQYLEANPEVAENFGLPYRPASIAQVGVKALTP